MKISGVLLLGLSLGLGVAACGSPVHVKAAYDKKADFDGYRTFAMLLPNQPVSSGIDVDPFTMQRLRQLTYAELEARGMKAVPLEEAELIVSVLAASKEKVDVYGGGGTYGPGYGYYGSRYGYGYDVQTYEEGTVVIDLVDRVKNAVIWRGTGQRRLGGKLSDAELAEVVSSILAIYPPGTLDQKK